MGRHQPKQRRPYTYEGRNHLKSWLRDTVEGQQILRELQPDMREWLYGTEDGRQEQAKVLERYSATTFVLIECFGDGYMRVYGDPHVRVKLVYRDIVGKLDDVEQEEAIEKRLPDVFKAIYYPGNCVYAWTVPYGPASDLWTTDQVEKMTSTIVCQPVVSREAWEIF